MSASPDQLVLELVGSVSRRAWWDQHTGELPGTTWTDIFRDAAEAQGIELPSPKTRAPAVAGMKALAKKQRGRLYHSLLPG